jgi:UDP-N-acetylmuramoylalanine--D-glutamate ligase
MAKTLSIIRQPQSPAEFFAKKNLLQMGLGILGGGFTIAQWLIKQHPKSITITDSKNSDDFQPAIKKLTTLAQNNKVKIKFVLGKHRQQDILTNDLIIVNQAIPLDIPLLKLAREKKKPIENDITLFYKFVKNPTLGITGTRGKTTTTIWLHHLLKSQFPKSIFGGNIPHKPAISLLNKIPPKNPIVLEIPSFQLELLKDKSPRIAVITNIYRDHLNRHHTMQNYIKAKANIFLHQTPNDYLILNYDDQGTKEFLKFRIPSQVYYSSLVPLPSKINGLFLSDNKLYFQEYGQKQMIANIAKFKRLGEHNIYNLLQAILAAKLFGLDFPKIVNQIATLPQIPMRQETIIKQKNLLVINDSASTIPEATIAALRYWSTFPNPKKKNLILITGGTDKDLVFNKLAFEIKETINPNNLILLDGSATQKLIAELQNLNYPLAYPAQETLKKCLLISKELIKTSRLNIVLFSPGATSLEKFKNEFDRGEKFNELTRILFRH